MVAGGAKTTISTLKRRPHRLCRPADDDAAKPRRHDPIAAGSDGLPEDGCSGRACRTAVIQNTIVCAPDGLRDQLRSMTRMQLICTLAAWRPDLTAYRDVDEAHRIAFKSLARRYLELHDEIADLDAMIAAIIDDWLRISSHAIRSATSAPRSFSSRPATIPRDCGLKPASHPCAA